MSDGRCPFAVWVGSPNFGYPQGIHGQLTNPLAIVDHIMDGTLSGCDEWFSHTPPYASSHFGIGKDGRIHQYVDLNDCAWANGAVSNPSARAAPVYTGYNPNVVTWSLEHEGKPEDEWTDAMYVADLRVKAYLWQRKAGLLLLGHCDIDSVNKSNCPGPHWPRERLLADLKEEPMGSGLSQISENWVLAQIRSLAGHPAMKVRVEGTGHVYAVTADALVHIGGPDQPIDLWNKYGFSDGEAKVIQPDDPILAMRTVYPFGVPEKMRG